jgi:hypothetical protein
VGGQPFDGNTGLASYGEKSQATSVFAFDVALSCADFSSVRDGWSVSASTPWRSGLVGDVGTLGTVDGATVGTSSADLVWAGFRHITNGADVHDDMAREGRVEVLDAPTAEGQKGRVRLRVVSATGDSVEGELPVEICTVYSDR